MVHFIAHLEDNNIYRVWHSIEHEFNHPRCMYSRECEKCGGQPTDLMLAHVKSIEHFFSRLGTIPIGYNLM